MKKASTASAAATKNDKINDSLNETLNTMQTHPTSQASIDSKSSGNQTGETDSSANPVATSNFSNSTVG